MHLLIDYMPRKPKADTPPLATASGTYIVSEFNQWEDAVTCVVEEKLEVTRSDAQSIVMAQDFVMSQCWGRGLDAQATAALVMQASASN